MGLWEFTAAPEMARCGVMGEVGLGSAPWETDLNLRRKQAEFLTAA
jgi:hypothetical protein